MESQPSQSSSVVPVAIGFEASLTFVALAVGWLIGVRPLESLSWNPRDLGWGLLATLPMFVGLWLMVRFPYGPFGDMVRVVDQHVKPMFRQATVLDLAVIALMAGIGEELLTRGVVQTALARWTGSVLAGLIGAGVLFGLVHSVTRTYAVMAAIVGIYFGCLWLATGNLLAPITAHAVYDFGALVWLVRNNRRTTR